MLEHYQNENIEGIQEMETNLELFEETCHTVRNLMKNRKLPNEVYVKKLKRVSQIEAEAKAQAEREIEEKNKQVILE